MEKQVSVNEAAVETADVAENDLPAVTENAAEGAVPPQKKKRRVNQQKLQDNLWGWIFCIPLIVGTVWFVYAALVMALMLSFTDYTFDKGVLTEFLANFGDNIAKTTNAVRDPITGLPTQTTVALDPFKWYRQIFTYPVENVGGVSGINMNEMGMYLFNTVFYMIGIPIGMILAMFFAVCMSRDIKGASVFRVLYYIPCVASTISIVFTFRLMFQQSGVINQILGTTNISWLGGRATTWNDLYRVDNPSTSDFMRNPYWCQGFLSKMMIVIMTVWKGLGGTIILYVAGLSWLVILKKRENFGRQCGDEGGGANRRRERLENLLEGHNARFISDDFLQYRHCRHRRLADLRGARAVPARFVHDGRLRRARL